MAKKRRAGGRTTPKGTRPGHLRSVPGGASDFSPADGLIDAAARELRREADALAAETWASMLLSLFDRTAADARGAGLDAPPFFDEILSRCRTRRDVASLMTAAALGSVVPPPVDAEARAVVGEILAAGVSAPGWMGGLGAAEPTEAWLVTETLGDQESVIIGFAGPHMSEHALVGLVDHNLSGQAKDVWIAQSAGAVAEEWRAAGDEQMQLEEVAPAEALGRLRDAMAMADLYNGDGELRSDDFVANRALVWARLRGAGLGDQTPAYPEVPEAERAAIVGDFLASPHGRAVVAAHPGVDVEVLASYVVGLRSDYEGRPLRWSPIVVADLLCHLAPRKLLLGPDEVEALPDVVRGFVRFAGERIGLPPPVVEETVEAVDIFEAEYLAQMGDPGAAGPAKAFLATLRARGIDIDDIDAIQAALADGGPTRLPEPGWGAQRGAGASAAPAEIASAAAQTVVMARFQSLTDFYGSGRKLTQKGRPTLADARELVKLLGTEDRLDEVIGDRTFKTRSAGELPELTFTIKWALAAGALRKEHGKLMVTKSWLKLADKPVERWLKAVDVLPTLGPLAAWYADHRYRHDTPLVDEVAGDLLAMLVEEPMSYDEALDFVCDYTDTWYEWDAEGWMGEPENRRKSFGWELDRLCSILSVAGVAERVGATAVPDKWDASRSRLVGGTLELTPLGRWWLGD